MDITLETDAKVIVGKYGSPAFDDRPVEVASIDQQSRKYLFIYLKSSKHLQCRTPSPGRVLRS